MDREFRRVFAGLILFGLFAFSNGVFCPHFGKDFDVLGRHFWRCTRRGTSPEHTTLGQPISTQQRHSPSGISPTILTTGITTPGTCGNQKRPRRSQRRKAPETLQPTLLPSQRDSLLTAQQPTRFPTTTPPSHQLATYVTAADAGRRPTTTASCRPTSFTTDTSRSSLVHAAPTASRASNDRPISFINDVNQLHQ